VYLAAILLPNGVGLLDWSDPDSVLWPNVDFNHVAGAIERDPMGRAGRALSDQDRHRGRVARGLSASPDLQRRIDGYEGMVRRYRQRFGALRRHLEGEGWMPPDPLIQMAGRSEGS
jgi:hypothetical protein